MRTFGAADPLERAGPGVVTARSRNAALRAALVTETRIAEALAQRSRGMVSLMERLTRRALADSADLAAAGLRIDALCRSLRDGLAAGETAEEGCLRSVAETTLAAFDMLDGPRIAIVGPPARLRPETRRLVSMTLFDLASRSQRFGALGLAEEGRVALDWAPEPGGGLRLTWREFGVQAGSERLRRGGGGALPELQADRFGGPLRLRTTPFGLVADLALPVEAMCAPVGPLPRRALVAVEDAAVAVTLSALLMACGVSEVGAARSVAEAAGALAAGDVDLVFVDDAQADAMPEAPGPAIVIVAPSGAAPAVPGRPVLTLPTSAARLAEAMAGAMLTQGGAEDPGAPA